MLKTLKATVEGDKLHWQESPDDVLPANKPVQVLVSILIGNSLDISPEAQGQRRVVALRKLASINALAAIHDPSKWQQETREDRELPGRES